MVGPLSNVLTAAWFTPDGDIAMTRVQVSLQTPPAGCKTNAVLQISDGTLAGTKTLAVTAANRDSGPLSVPYSAGRPISLGISVRAAGCDIRPQDANVIVQYKGR